jgi:hypothetical protein
VATLIRVKLHQPEAHPGGVVDQIGDDLLGHCDAAFDLTHPGFIVIHEIAQAQPAL